MSWRVRVRVRVKFRIRVKVRIKVRVRIGITLYSKSHLTYTSFLMIVLRLHSLQ